ncbi:putative aspartate aminotransferase [Aspergillus flavus]|uniref:Aspartate aminotransferase n=1 Tax=Aspergillus flavus (strain ATCC 200026 / FGSC A1120 / IAM 13836 / NRRL 3357 / JCM 12722 / SRRC 167) TaxID=332952 RepID=A0A7U2MTD0_ASPFN|nr:hypothetical protein AFLA_001827 [Aspergillus flavus NRRL3357]QRD89483.1 putative aspartate aminotransferase [Aspergillus flavus]
MAHPFQDIPKGQLEALEGLIDHFRADTDSNKTHLMVGVYKTDHGKAYVLPSVKQAKEKMFNDPNWHHEYRASHLGTQNFRDASNRLFFGANSRPLQEGRIVSMQTLGASGGCHTGAVLLRDLYGPWKRTGKPEIFIPRDSWLNHAFTFKSAGITPHFLPYFNAETASLDFPALSTAIRSLPAQSVVVLQTNAQNPTGCDPSPTQWRELASIFSERGHLAFFDAAYPGLASGDIDTDLECVRLFAEQEIPMVFVATYGKCFGLYCERVGILSIITPDQEVRDRMETQMRLLVRAESGAMPDFGSTIIETILSDERLEQQWRDEVHDMAKDLQHRRRTLRTELERLGTPGDWRHITDQNGFFSYIRLSAEQITGLRIKHHVYLQDSGRISIAGLNSSNIGYVARSIDDVIRTDSRLPN